MIRLKLGCSKVQSWSRLLSFSSIVGFALLGIAGCKPSGNQESGKREPEVGVEAVVSRKLSPEVPLTGRVEAIHDVQIRPRVMGYITAMNAREGAEVAKGSLLFTIDSRPYVAVLARANAELARASIRVAQAKRDLDRAKQLAANNALAPADRESIESAAAQALAEGRAAQAAVDNARLDVDSTEVRAPVAGRVGRAMASLGDFVSGPPAPTTLTTLTSVDPIYVYFTIDEPTYLRVAAHFFNSQVGVGLANEDGYPRLGKVDFVDNHLDEATGTIRFRVRLANKDRRLLPGLYARGLLAAGAPVEAIAIDNKAILTDQDRKYVLIVVPDGTVVRKDVVLGPILDGLRVVETGLAVADRVVVNGTLKVNPGMKVTVAPAAGSPGESKP